jgi:hypothetical protein
MVDVYQDAEAVAKVQADPLECCTSDEEYSLLVAGISIVSTSVYLLDYCVLCCANYFLATMRRYQIYNFFDDLQFFVLTLLYCDVTLFVHARNKKTSTVQEVF